MTWLRVLLVVWCVGAPAAVMFYVGYRAGRFDERRQCLHGDAYMRDPKVMPLVIDVDDEQAAAIVERWRRDHPPLP